MKTKSQKSSSIRKIFNFSNNLYNNLLRLEFLIVSNKFPKLDSSGKYQNFQISKELNHKHFFTGIFQHKIFFLESQQGKQARSFDMGNSWWTINNINCRIDVNIKSACCNNFTQIAKIQPIRRLLVNIIWSKLIRRAKWKDL